MVEHPAAIRQVLGSTPSVPLFSFDLYYQYRNYVWLRTLVMLLYTSRDRLVVRTLRCGRSNPGSINSQMAGAKK